jgi:hypothetical protein
MAKQSQKSAVPPRAFRSFKALQFLHEDLQIAFGAHILFAYALDLGAVGGRVCEAPAQEGQILLQSGYARADIGEACLPPALLCKRSILGLAGKAEGFTLAHLRILRGRLRHARRSRSPAGTIDG